MIEATTEFIFKKNKKKRKGVKVLFFIIVLTLLFLYHKFFIAKNVFAYCEKYIYSSVIEKINNSVTYSLENLEYSNLVSIEKNSNDEITLISANSIKVNAVARKIIELSKIAIDSHLSKGVPIPLLCFTGLEFISGYGKTVYFKNLIVNSVDCEFVSDFKSVGINQTLHSISVKILCNVYASMPLNNQDILMSSNILICENVIVGKVPDFYLGKNIF